MVDPLKVEEITQFTPSHTIQQLQSLQGKVNFLRWFVSNYANIMKGFMLLLKKRVPFLWDEAAQRSFETLKKYFVSNPLFNPLDYNQDILLYLAAFKSSIDMVLI
jgi:hypothetical protein